MNDHESTLPHRPTYRGARLVAQLKNRGWTQARDLAPCLGLSTRELRAVAADSGGRVITGQRGYCLIEEAAPPEVEKSAAWLISQGNKMIARGLDIRRRGQVEEGAR